MKDKYSAVWLSHSSISDYLKCPRSYFLKNIYKDKTTGRKIAISSPPLTLGQAVHETIEGISRLPVSDRLAFNLRDEYLKIISRFPDHKGGFRNPEEEIGYRNRGLEMIQRVVSFPGPMAKPAVKIRQDLPYLWLSEEDNIILCGKIDWLEYLPETDGVRIIDFKTGKFDEDPDSLQLTIYQLLVSRCQTKPVVGAAYWYLERDNAPSEVSLPDIKTALQTLMPIAKKIALARKLQHFSCPQTGGCRACQPYEFILAGKGELVDVRDNRDVYYLP